MPKRVFVIMPFVKANTRNEATLTKFFEDYIKHPIENATTLSEKYTVARSGHALQIVETIIADLAQADIVICDLSGPNANPNVMFELGLRLSTSQKPTILIREDASSNEKIFDISGLYTHAYSANATRDLERFLLEKLKAYESGGELYSSPVLKALNQDAAFWMLLPVRKASAFLGGIASATEAHLRALSSAIALFMAKKGESFSPSAPARLYDALHGLSDSSLLDDFAYNISSIPSLDSYLSSVYLLGLVDDEIERSFRSYAMAYSLHFSRGNSSFFTSTHHEEYTLYAFETLLLMNFARLLIRILAAREGSQERIDLANEFKNQLSKSNIAT